jgi:Zn-dependent alcohol dehydrogenase
MFLSTAKKFGVTEFVNPKDHDKPVHEVCKKINHVRGKGFMQTYCFSSNFDFSVFR